MTEAKTDTETSEILKTPLHQCHLEQGARMVPFAGYDMPVQYDGIVAEHTHCRKQAGLFDVSHMGQAFLDGPDHQQTAAALETMTAADIAGLAKGQQRYTQLLNKDGGIIDDLMVSRTQGDGRLLLVVNAARKAVDFAHIEAHLPAAITLTPRPQQALIAIQGPQAVNALEQCLPGVAAMNFMSVAEFDMLTVSRSGYTGEDGFEISVPESDAVTWWQKLLAEPQVKPIGLGARDSLRLEAGLCLYGHDIDETTNPVEAALSWSIGKRRREEGGFAGYERIKSDLQNGPSRRRVGLKPQGRAPAREGSEIVNANGETIGHVTSGGFAPSIGEPIAMGYVLVEHAKIDNDVNLMVRGKPLAARICKMPFVTPGYKR